MSEIRITYDRHGPAQEVLSTQEVPLADPAPGQLRIRMDYANINPSDLGMIGGTYGRLPQLPAVAGREGVGTVESIHPGTRTSLKTGDRVRMPESLGAWRSHVICEPEGLIKVPSDIAAEQAATLFINPPTALLLLEQFVDLKPGDWVIQNAANSSVGIWVIQLCKLRGLHSVNLVRRNELAAPLQALGADIVLEDNDDNIKQLKAMTGGNLAKLALNSVGGASVIRLIRGLADGGTCVTFGGMVGDPIRFPTRNLIFNDVHLCGFWMDKWMRS
ncbi:MAG: 2-enoyl thioester reductase domain-containing protein, partial [Opitutales bacterium]|nr:2-enoyl thioester reductase domain-containing protein [Opitutales bacterium]